MQKEDVEPVLFVPRHIHPYTVASELKVHTRILDVADTIQAETSDTLAQKDRLNCYSRCLSFNVTCWKIYFAHEVEKTGYREKIQGTECSFLGEPIHK